MIRSRFACVVCCWLWAAFQCVWACGLVVSLSLYLAYLAYLLDRPERMDMEVDGDNRAACSRCCSAARCSQHTRYGGVSLVGCAYAKRACWALSCCLLLGCHNHTHTSVCVVVAAAVAVGQAPLGRSAVGIVCLWVRVGW